MATRVGQPPALSRHARRRKDRWRVTSGRERNRIDCKLRAARGTCKPRASQSPVTEPAGHAPRQCDAALWLTHCFLQVSGQRLCG